MQVAYKARGRIVAAGLVVGFVALNAVAFLHAHAMTHFSRGSARTPGPASLSGLDKLSVLARGVRMPRPVNRADPHAWGLPYERHVFRAAHGLAVEAWLIPSPGRRGVILLFHGHAASKDSLLPAAAAFRRMGYATFLVDFHGSGGSEGRETSIGFHEAADVEASVNYVRELETPGRIVLYGQSMGAAAVLKALADGRLGVDGAILECPFDSLLNTVKHRFTSMGLPSFPFAHLLTFWGGLQQGFNPFRHNPAEYARRVETAVLLMNGDRDERVSVADVTRIHDNLEGRKRLKLFHGLGHQSFVRARRDEWLDAVAAFVDSDVARP